MEWCYVCVSLESGLFVYMTGPRYRYSVLCGYLRILGASIFQSCYTLSISASYRVGVSGQISQIQTCLRVVVGP